ncbi:fimbrial protein [Morganella psychrotolerans]|uniref:fimbrial protein n=1 Tax=Morganella psychrotolerans TaxID=368603 RepID=UPI0039B1008E
MILVNNKKWLLSAISFFSMPLMAECNQDSEVAKTAQTHIQQRIEGKIQINELLASDVLQIENISVCNNSSNEGLRLIATQPNSEASPKFFRVINGVPAYYLNKDYAYTIKMDDFQAYTARGMRISMQVKNGIVNIPRSSVSVYAAVDNPAPLRLSSSQIGLIKNENHDTVAKLMLSASIDTVETCYINNKQLDFNFGDIDMLQFPAGIGKTDIGQSNTISITCSNEKRNKDVSIQLSGATLYASAEKSVIASANTGIGFVLYHDKKQITQNSETNLGSMKGQLNPMITAYIYKLKNRIEPGSFEGRAEYTIKFN